MAKNNQSTIEERLDRIEKRIEDNLSYSKWVLGFDDAVKYTGLSRSYLYKLTSSRQIPCAKPRGKKLYFLKDSLDQWLLSNPVTTNEELEARAATYLATK